MEKCYITSIRTTHKDRKNLIVGSCGPCSIINLIDLNGSFQLEKELVELGRMKPFYASNFTSFLIWAEHFNKKIIVYVEDMGISEGTFKMIFKYEKIPKEKQQILKNDCLRRHAKLIKKNKDKIHKLIDNPLKMINYLLVSGYLVAFNMADYFGGSFLVGHYKVCFGKKGDYYLIKDSGFGDIEGIYEISKKQMNEHLNNVKKMGGTYEIIAYKD